MDIKAIETVYNGYRFRSRLEARWAVFFDALGINYEYEPEGLELNDGTRYLPDFWLPTFDDGLYCEVKFAGGDFTKALCLAKQAKVWICEGTPAIAIYKIAGYNRFMCGIPNYQQAMGEDRMYAMPCELSGVPGGCGGRCEQDYHPIIIDPDLFHDYGRGNVCAAIVVARQARFEHGETPR